MELKDNNQDSSSSDESSISKKRVILDNGDKQSEFMRKQNNRRYSNVASSVDAVAFRNKIRERIKLMGRTGALQPKSDNGEVKLNNFILLGQQNLIIDDKVRNHKQKASHKDSVENYKFFCEDMNQLQTVSTLNSNGFTYSTLFAGGFK